MKRIVRLLRELAIRVFVVAWPRTRVEGIQLYDLTFRDRLSNADLLRVSKALRLIRTTTAWVYSGLIRRMPRIIVAEAGGPEFVPSAKACIINSAHLRSAKTEDLALLFIHEATHARIWNRGIGYPVTLRSRIEELCVEAEVSWARRLPGGHDLAAEASKKLSRPWWHPSQEVERHERQTRELQ